MCVFVIFNIRKLGTMFLYSLSSSPFSRHTHTHTFSVLFSPLLLPFLAGIRLALSGNLIILLRYVLCSGALQSTARSLFSVRTRKHKRIVYSKNKINHQAMATRCPPLLSLLFSQKKSNKNSRMCFGFFLFLFFVLQFLGWRRGGVVVP